jgi:vacuolar protein sorting-associated protein 33A
VTTLKTYGYDNLPLLLSLAAPPLAILLPTPLPPSTPPSLAASKYPFVSLRKSLRLLIDDNPEALDEVENDISFVYSGYAPISIRLVQCVAQKGGVLSNPAEKGGVDGSDGNVNAPTLGRIQAHPIIGWKGFDDVVASIPGETFDIGQKRAQGAGEVPAVSAGKLRESFWGVM